jgi:hypothetical protein
VRTWANVASRKQINDESFEYEEKKTIFFHHPSTEPQQLVGTANLSSCKTSNERTAVLVSPLRVGLDLWVTATSCLLIHDRFTTTKTPTRIA